MMGIFDNATSVVIGNKEVQSIIGPNGEVFYQKAASHSYALSFSSASYQTDSSGDVTVYVTLTDNGVPVSGETVNFSDATSVYTGITNNLGVVSVSLNYHSNGTVTASYSNASATASIVSNYTPSYTGVLSFTPSNLVLVIDPSIPYSEESQTYLLSVAGVSVEELIYNEIFDTPTVANINQSEYTTYDILDFIVNWGLPGFDINSNNDYINASNDLINEYEIDYLPLVRAVSEDGETEYSVTYTATSATDVTITISQ